MRYRLLASYQGAPYEAGVGPADSDVVLFAACPPPEDLRFEPATGHWRKQVHLAEVQTLHESRPVGMFRGERCVVLDDLTDRLHIVYLGHDAYRAEQIGYWEVDRGVFELITPRHEVTDIVEERLAFPHRGDGTWQTAGAHPASDPPGQSRDGFVTGPQVAHDGPDARDATTLGPDSPGRGAFTPERTGHGTEPQPTFTPRQRAPGLGSNATGTFTQAPGVADYERPTRDVAPSHPPDGLLANTPLANTPLAGGSDGDPGRSLPATGFGRTPDPAPARDGSAPASDRSVLSEHESAPDLSSAPGFLAATDVSGVAVPMIDEPPLPLEAQALRAASAAHRREPQVPPSAATSTAPAESATEAQGAPPIATPAEGVAAAGGTAASPRGGTSATAEPAQDRPRALVGASAAAQPLATATAPQRPSQPPAADAAASPPMRPAAATQPAQDLAAATSTPSARDAVQPNVRLVLDSATAAARPPRAAPTAVAVPFRDTPQDAAGPAHGRSAPAAVQQVQERPAIVATPLDDAPRMSAVPFEDTPRTPAAPVEDAPVSVSDPMPQAPPATPEQESRQAPADEAESQPTVVPRRRRAAKRRLPTQRIFSDLAAQAAIPATAYAVGEDVDGAMCLMRTDEGFEVFNSAAGARHEVRVFQDEESAYFYLFGVLVADAVRTGALAPRD